MKAEVGNQKCRTLGFLSGQSRPLISHNTPLHNYFTVHEFQTKTSGSSRYDSQPILELQSIPHSYVDSGLYQFILGETLCWHISTPRWLRQQSQDILCFLDAMRCISISCNYQARLYRQISVFVPSMTYVQMVVHLEELDSSMQPQEDNPCIWLLWMRRGFRRAKP